MRIAIIGYSGAGKSSLARTLGERYGIPVLFLDTVQFTANWAERDRGEARAMVEAFMARPDWVIDGNYRNFAQAERLALADRIVFLDFPRRICVPRAVGRYCKYRNRARESMADGCIEKFDWEFFCWLMWKGRTKPVRDHYQYICGKYAGKLSVLKNPAQVEQFLREIQHSQ